MVLVIGEEAASLSERENGTVGGGGGIGGKKGSVEGLSEEDDDAEAEEGGVVDEDPQLVGEEAEVVLDGGRGAFLRGLACDRVDGVPEAGEEEAWVSNAHCP